MGCACLWVFSSFVPMDGLDLLLKELRTVRLFFSSRNGILDSHGCSFVFPFNFGLFLGVFQD